MSKILLITDGLPPDVLGGTGNIVMNLAEGLTQRGHEVATLSSSASPTNTNDHYQLRDRANRWAHYRSVFSGTRANEVLKIINKVKPNVIHAHTIANQIGYRWMNGARKCGIPVIMTAHDVMNVACGRVTGLERSLWVKDLLRCKWGWNPLRTIMIRHILNTHVKVFAVSDALRLFMEKHGLTNVETQHNGIDENVWQSMDQAEARANLSLPADACIFVLAGRLGFDKGTTLIAKTLPKNAHLILAGRANLAEFAAVKDRIHYFEHQDSTQMRQLYAASDAVLVPSRCLDCFPTICLEAMSCARPVLATTWGGAKESVVDGKTGWTIDPLDEHAWAQRMQWCCDHRADLKSMGEHARHHVTETFSLPSQLDALERIYSQLVASTQT